MALGRSVSQRVPFANPRKGSKPQKSHPGVFPSAPTIPISRLSLQKQKLLYGRLPPSHGILQPHQIAWLTYYLSIPVETKLLPTMIAALGPPLTRDICSHKANCLCEVHTWLELRWVEELMMVVAEEMGPGLEKLRQAPREMLSRPTKKHINRLESYRHLFPATHPVTGRLPVAEDGNCKACKLSQFFQNPKAVRALEILAKGRKHRASPYPDACAWLDPNPGKGWEMRWKRQAECVLKDRSNVRDWLKQIGWENTTKSRASTEMQIPREPRSLSSLGDRDGEELSGLILPGQRPVSFIPSFREMTPSPPGSPYGSPTTSPYGSISDWEKDTDASSVSSARTSGYTWEIQLVDEYALDPKSWCFDESATKKEVLSNLKNMSLDEDDSHDRSKEKPRKVDRESWSGEEKDDVEYNWDESDDEEGTLVNERQATEWAMSYANLVGDLPPSRTNSVMPQYDGRRFF